jgi:hapalindole-type alkaloid chlorinase
MKTRDNPAEPLFHFLEIDAVDVDRYPTVIADIMGRRFDGVIVRGVLSKDVVARVVDRLERRDPPFPRAVFPGFPDSDASPHILGRAIVASDPDLAQYFAAAADFRRCLRELFGGELDFEARLEAIFGALSGGLPAQIPVRPGGSAPHDGTYTPATVRVLPDGQEIGVHVGNAFLHLPQAKHLASIVEVADQLSYFVPLTVPESGGELVVYALEWADTERYVTSADGGLTGSTYDASGESVRFIELCDKTTFAPGPGDLLVFDGGRYYHRITPVRGARPRRTIGGFLALTKDHRAVAYWS